MRSTAAKLSEPTATSAIGEALRARRRALGMNLQSAAFASGVRSDHLSALERGDMSALPTLGYALGYVRAYARVLELDPEGTVAEFKAEISAPRQLDRRGVPHFVPTRKLRLPKGSVPALGVIAAVVMLGVWYGVQLETVASPAPVSTPAMDPASVEASPTLPDSVVTLQANAPSWVSIRDARGQLITNRVFVTGERWQAARGQAFTITVRDGGAVELMIGERSLGALGRPGEPVTDYQLGAVD